MSQEMLRAHPWQKYTPPQSPNIAERVTHIITHPGNVLQTLRVACGVAGEPADEPADLAAQPQISLNAIVRDASGLDGYVLGWRTRLFSKIGTWRTTDDLWTFTLLMTSFASMNPFQPLNPQLLVVIECRTASEDYTVSAEVGLAVTLEEPFRHMHTRVVPSRVLSVNDIEILRFDDTHPIAVQVLDWTSCSNYLEVFQTQNFDHALIHFDLRGRVLLTPKTSPSDRFKSGAALIANMDLVNGFVEAGQLSLLDVQHLRWACKSLRVGLAQEAEHRLLRAFSKYFPGKVDVFVRALQAHGAVVGGSLMLSVLKPGGWTPSDLDIILPEHTAHSFEAFLTENGYSKEIENHFRQDNEYGSNGTSRHDFRYVCFKNAAEKIDLCYIRYPHPAASHVLTYHSTAVMNFFDGWAFYCLFPEWTFSGKFVRNGYHVDYPERTARAINKLLARGFTEVGGVIQEWHPQAVSPRDGWIDAQKLTSIWRHKVHM